jgi:hypothetical protein
VSLAGVSLAAVSLATVSLAAVTLSGCSDRPAAQPAGKTRPAAREEATTPADHPVATRSTVTPTEEIQRSAEGPPTEGGQPAEAVQPTDTAPGPLSRNDPPPAGVEAQFEHFPTYAGDYPRCPVDPTPQVLVIGAGVEILDTVSAKLCWFEGDEPIVVRLVRPDNTAEQLSPPQGYRVGWFAGVGQPAGTYAIEVRQGESVASATFEVKARSVPKMFVAPSEAPAGAVIELSLAGFEPHSRLAIHVYHRPSADVVTDRYVTTIAVAADGRGEAVSRLETSATDPPGRYTFRAGDTSAVAEIGLPLRPSATSRDPRTRSVLARRDPPPGVDAVIETGGKGCRELTEPGISQISSLGDGRTWIGDALTICVGGFEPSRALDVVVALPDASERRTSLSVRADGTAALVWKPRPPDPFGRYVATISDAGRTLATEFQVEASSVPSVFTDPPAAVAGSAFDVVVTGFTPDADVRLDFYRQHPEDRSVPSSPGVYRYVTSVTVHTDGQGNGLRPVRTGTGDPAGRYAIRASCDGCGSGTRDASGGVEVRDGAILVDPSTSAAGATFSVDVIGQAPSADIDLVVYRLSPDGGIRRVGTLAMRTDGDGHATTRIFTVAGEPPGTYRVTAGGADIGAEFQVTPGN